MIIEQLSVTSTATSVYDLLVTARGSFDGNTRITSVNFRCDTDVTEKVYCEDSNTVTPVTLLNPADDIIPQPFASYEDMDINQVKLSCDTGPVVVEMIASQR